MAIIRAFENIYVCICSTEEMQHLKNNRDNVHNMFFFQDGEENVEQQNILTAEDQHQNE